MKSFEDFKPYIERFNAVISAINCSELEKKQKELESELAQPNVYADSNSAKRIGSELREIGEIVANFKYVNDLFEFVKDSERAGDFAVMDLLNDEENKLITALDQLEMFSLFKGEFDENDCLIEIHAGAGGEDAQDWAEMLALMYIKYAESHDYSAEILEATDGDGAGIKSETIKISGSRAYGKLKNETGVHRLVRISPFDSNARRHTSFASVLVTPVVEENNDIEIKPEDLKIDTYRSSGAGGQHVNKTESAVRITHLPTGTVVACQNERSQIQNREQAMKMLISKLTALRQIELDEKRAGARKEQKKIEWGSQIRSYVFAPYTQVKDLRTGAVNTNINKVMAGDLDLFINEGLKCL